MKLLHFLFVWSFSGIIIILTFNLVFYAYCSSLSVVINSSYVFLGILLAPVVLRLFAFLCPTFIFHIHHLFVLAHSLILLLHSFRVLSNTYSNSTQSVEYVHLISSFHLYIICIWCSCFAIFHIAFCKHKYHIFWLLVRKGTFSCPQV